MEKDFSPAAVIKPGYVVKYPGKNTDLRGKEMTEDILKITRSVFDQLNASEVCRKQAKICENLIEKLENDDITVSVIGQFKRGKSTLSNAVLGGEIMPVGIVPITSAVTKVIYGEEKSAEVHFFNGAVKNVDFSDLSTYISEQENEDNVLGVSEVVIKWPSDFLKRGLTYVDTPGVGSFHKNNTEVAYEYMKESDAVIFLLSVDSPINQIEIDFLYNTREYAGKFYFAVNKIDTVGESDLNAYMKYCEKLLKELMDTDKIMLYPVSSREGTGLEELENAILRDCDTSIREIMEASTRKKLRELISSALNQLTFYGRAMNMEYAELDRRFAEINEYISEIKEKASGYEAIFEIHLNEIKLLLSGKVYELFGMEYTYDIAELRQSMLMMTKEEFMKQVDDICADLKDTLDRVLLYREENAYVVVRKTSALKRLAKNLKKIQSGLED